jgi:transposase
MAKALTIKLTKKQQQQLESIRSRHPKAYVRERAAAVLKVAAGASARSIAAAGFFNVRDHETIAEWVRRFKKDGAEGLLIRAGRGRKPSFFPSGAD